MSDLKQVIIIRNDLKLPKGKMAAQAAHASVDATLKAEKGVVSSWRANGMAKIALKVETEKDLYKYIQIAKDQGMPTSIISDAGRTCIAPGTVTCGAIGPASENDIDNIVGELKLM